MSTLLDLSKYCLYRLATEPERLIAIPVEYEKQIQSHLKEWGSLKKVPADKTVRGVFLSKNDAGELELMANPGQENDITINQLEKPC